MKTLSFSLSAPRRRRRAGMLVLGLAFIGGTGCVTTRLVEGGFTKQQAQERARAREEKTS